MKKKNEAMWWLKWVLISVALYIFSRRQASAWRGYTALGGEVFCLLLPWLAWTLKETVGDWKTLVKEELGGRHE